MSAVATCPTWCERPDCGGDHSAIAGKSWPQVRATGHPRKWVPTLTAYPTWGEVEGLAAAVCLWIDGDDCGRDVDVDLDLTPDEAEALALRLLAVAAAVRS